MLIQELKEISQDQAHIYFKAHVSTRRMFLKLSDTSANSNVLP